NPLREYLTQKRLEILFEQILVILTCPCPSDWPVVTGFPRHSLWSLGVADSGCWACAQTATRRVARAIEGIIFIVFSDFNINRGVSPLSSGYLLPAEVAF